MISQFPPARRLSSPWLSSQSVSPAAGTHTPREPLPAVHPQWDGHLLPRAETTPPTSPLLLSSGRKADKT